MEVKRTKEAKMKHRFCSDLIHETIGSELIGRARRVTRETLSTLAVTFCVSVVCTLHFLASNKYTYILYSIRYMIYIQGHLKQAT